jgi:transposase
MVVPSKEAKTNGAAGIDAEGGRTPTAVPAPATAAPELLDRPRRRTFTAQTKLRVLAETDGAATGGASRQLRWGLQQRPVFLGSGARAASACS